MKSIAGVDMRSQMAVLLFGWLVGNVDAAVQSQPNVTLPGLGTVYGLRVAADNGQELEAYLGIPYAKAPVGHLRWEEPEDVAAWGTLHAKAFGSTCPGAGCFVPESEDCLYMNIYRPSNLGKKKVPVYFWIHGGAFQSGCANQFQMDRFVAAAAAEGRPVIGVTINYRLGVFGFLGSDELRGNDTSVSTGNFGMQDQRKALEFVNKYIDCWGGRAEKVTVAGQSAGAASVGAHMVMPKSSKRFENGKLFSAAVAQSGLTALWGAKSLKLAEEVYEGVKALVGCADLACMRQKTVADFAPVNVQFSPIPNFKYLPFSPVIDGVELTAHPWELTRDKKAMKVRMLAGSNRDEFAYLLLLAPFLLKFDATEQDFDALLAPYMRKGEDETAADLAQLKCLYSKAAHDYPVEMASSGFSYWWWAGMRALSDHEFTCPSRRGSIWLAAASSARVYSYMFIHPTESPSFFPWTGVNSSLVTHSLELLYTFNCTLTPLGCSFSVKSEAQLANTMMSSWAEFVDRQRLSRPWKKQRGKKNKERTLLLDIAEPAGEGFVIKKKLRAAECDFWDDILESTYADDGN